MKNYKISASILSANFAKLGEEVDNVLSAGADFVHFDVMDNHYVPNLTVGALVCKALRDYGIKAPIDVHLMTNPVDRLITDFAKAGATYITIHPDATDDLEHSIGLIHDHGCKAGLAINPGVDVDCLNGVLDKLQMVLVMSVNPGFAGQKFIAEVLPKVAAIRKLIEQKNLPILLSIDGGIKLENIAEAANAGVDTFVIGSGLFGTNNYAATVAAIRNKLKI
jgi:ribulose-phosphate 3-epimerase